MTDLFTLPELASYLQRDLDTATATLARDTATALVLDATGPIVQSTSTIVLPLGSGDCVDIPVKNIVSVDSVTISSGGITWVWEQPYPRIRLIFFTQPLYAYWPMVTMTITHGFATVPPIIKAVALSAAGRIYDNPRGLRSEQIDDYSYTRGGNDDNLIGITLTETEIRTLAKFADGSYVTSA